jgi:DNA-binding MarR family transcriptional regulator
MEETSTMTTEPTTEPTTQRDTSATPHARQAARAWESLFRAQVTLMRRFLADDTWDELNMREYDVLYNLSTAPGGGLRLRDLNENVLMAQSSLSRMVERLEGRGLVERSVPSDDARGTVVTLTDRGRRLQRETGAEHVRTIERYVGDALDADDLEALTRILDRLRAAQAQIPDLRPGRR